MITPRPHQIGPVTTAVSALRAGRNVADLSDTGTGKTFTALLTAHAMSRNVLVVCPKSVIPAWRKAAEACDVEAEIINYEALMARGHLKGVGVGWWSRKPSAKGGKGGTWEWAAWVCECTIIFDEAHRLSGISSQTSKLATGAKRQGIPSMALSATLADSPLKLNTLGILLDLHEGSREGPGGFRNFLARHGCAFGSHGGFVFRGEKRHLEKIHKTLRDRGQLVRVRASEIEGFPSNFISAWDIPCEGRPDDIYEEMQEEFMASPSEAAALVIAMRARQRAELLKAPGMVEMANDLVADGNRVAIFVCFRETFDVIQAGLGKKHLASQVLGGQSTAERDREIEAFVTGGTPVINCMIAAGGVGVSLHDDRGLGQVVSLISPSWSAVEFRQALGRICRDGSHTDAFQRVVFCEGSTAERKVRAAIEAKLDNLDALNDADLDITGLTSAP